MMRILLLTPQLPYPPHQGTSIRNYGLVRGLARRHSVSLLSFLEAQQSLAVAGPLLDVCHRVEAVAAPPPRRLVRRAFDTLTHRLPDMGLRLVSTAFSERLAAWMACEPFDIVHVEGIEMVPYMAQLLDETAWVNRKAPLIVFDDHNCEYMLQKRYAQIDARLPRRWPGALYSLLQWLKLRPYEAGACRQAHCVVAVSQADAQALRRLVPGLAVTVVPNGIDTQAYQAMPSTSAGAIGQDAAQEQEPSPALHPLCLVFTGKMDYRPNVDAVSWFATDIWPRVRDELPQAHFYAVGQRPHHRLDPLRVDPSLTLTGWVEDVRPFITGATVYVAPLRMGSGTRLKLLEAMALGKAIVSTRLGAEGLVDLQGEPVTDGREMVLVDDDAPLAFAEAVVALLRDPDRRTELGRAARVFVEANYDWRVIVPRLEALYARH